MADLRAPTIQDLIEALKDGILDDNTVALITTDPKKYAESKGWTFAGDDDQRIVKFKSMQPPGFGLARGMYNAAALRDQPGMLNNLAQLMCAASRIVPWSGKNPLDVAPTC